MISHRFEILFQCLRHGVGLIDRTLNGIDIGPDPLEFLMKCRVIRLIILGLNSGRTTGVNVLLRRRFLPMADVHSYRREHVVVRFPSAVEWFVGYVCPGWLWLDCECFGRVERSSMYFSFRRNPDPPEKYTRSSMFDCKDRALLFASRTRDRHWPVSTERIL